MKSRSAKGIRLEDSEFIKPILANNQNAAETVEGIYNKNNPKHKFAEPSSVDNQFEKLNSMFIKDKPNHVVPNSGEEPITSLGNQMQFILKAQKLKKRNKEIGL
ncbi:hypothetical protein L1887_39310 [Cichorium endivia]|nr:hypothetical protein L1887_39310 [Cichorium endivia]